MKSLRAGARVGWFAAICFVAAVALADDADSKSARAMSPDALVRAALRSELAGPSTVRKTLLEQALKLDPDFAPALWQSGLVRWNDQWLTLEQAARRASDDPQLTAYRKLRDEMLDTADGHRELARWCHKNKLKDEERIHWTKVLEFDRNDVEALAALDLHLRNGRLVTPAQLTQENKLAAERQQAFRRWQPKIARWCGDFVAARNKSSDAARSLKGLSEPAALGALAAAVVGHQAANNAELNRLLIEAIGRLREAEATEVLLRCAVYADSPDLRTRSADELKKRPLYAFVPTLLNMMPGPVSTRFEIYVMPDGTVVHDHAILRQDGVNDLTAFESQGRSVRPTPQNTRVKLEQAQDEAIKMEMQALQETAARAAMSLRIQDVLSKTTDFHVSDDRQAMLDQWVRYMDTYAMPVTSTPLRQQFFGTVRYLSCFPAGTPVATITGPVAIESVKIGDRLLAQRTDTGELAFKIVRAVTLRPPAPLIRIGIGSQTISATRGHPFWVNGRGWLMAKQLEIGMILHGLDGGHVIDSLTDAQPREAYNLVVNDFDTYFVGQQPILVHDNMPLVETTAAVPGLARRDAE